jgi:signal transduction histidine kinase
LKSYRVKYLFPLSQMKPLYGVSLALSPIFILMFARPFYPEAFIKAPIALFYPLTLFATYLCGSLAGLIGFLITTVFVFGILKPEMISNLQSDQTLFLRTLMFFVSAFLLLLIVRAFEKALFRAEQMIQQRDDFLSIVSHELKTPITSIRLQMEVLKDRYQGNFDLQSALGPIEKMVNRQDKLVSSMLDLAMIESGHIGLRKEDCDLSTIISKATFLAQQSLDCKDVILEAQKLMIKCDRHRMEQVIFNLVHNAIKYGDKKSIGVSLSSDGKQAFIKITNSGNEIEGKHIPNIFKKMMRPLISDQVQGLGVGLFLAKHLVEMHKGSIEVVSEKQTGTTFTVSLPII